MFLLVFFPFLVSISNVEGLTKGIHCQKENSIINVSTIKIEGLQYVIQVDVCYEGKINSNELVLSEENCFLKSTQTAEVHPSAIYCFTDKVMSEVDIVTEPKVILQTTVTTHMAVQLKGNVISKPEDNLRTSKKEMAFQFKRRVVSEPMDISQTSDKKMAIQFEYCGDNCCKEDEENHLYCYKCLVNRFGDLGNYHAIKWENFLTDNLVQISESEMIAGENNNDDGPLNQTKVSLQLFAPSIYGDCLF